MPKEPKDLTDAELGKALRSVSVAYSAFGGYRRDRDLVDEAVRRLLPPQEEGTAEGAIAAGKDIVETLRRCAPHPHATSRICRAINMNES